MEQQKKLEDYNWNYEEWQQELDVIAEKEISTIDYTNCIFSIAEEIPPNLDIVNFFI